MEHTHSKLSFEQVRAIDLVSYLAGIGYQPTKIKGHDFWYLSPLRIEKTPSFKVNTRINRWYDFGSGMGGSLIDFGMAYYGCSLSGFMKQLQGELHLNPMPPLPEQAKKISEEKIRILDSRPLSSNSLVRYLEQRKIPLAIASPFCSEVRFRVGHRSYFAIGFRNNSGGYEFRNTWFKGSSSPKAISTIKNNQNCLTVFEGFFDFLSFLVLYPGQVPATDFLILNGLSLFEKGRPFLEGYASVKLYLDNNTAGKLVSAYALSLGSFIQNMDHLYNGFDDLNDFLCNKPAMQAEPLPRPVRPP